MLKEVLPAPVVVVEAEEDTILPRTPDGTVAEFKLAATNAVVVARGEAVVEGNAISPIVPVIVPAVSARKPCNLNPVGSTTLLFLSSRKRPARE